MNYGTNLWGPPGADENKQFFSLNNEYSTAQYENDWRDLTEPQGDLYFSHDRLGKELYEFISDKATQQTPFSIIRLGDGEGCLAFRNQFPNFSKLANYVEARISEIMFGDKGTVPNALKAFFQSIQNATISADIIGISPLNFPLRRLDSESPENVDVRAICGVKAQIHWVKREMQAGNIHGMFADAWLSRYLLPYYKKIVSLFPKVFIITGNPQLDTLMEAAFGVSAHLIPIPTQRALRSSKSPENIHFPDRYITILNEIKNIPQGSLVLVGAGLLGKGYCAAIKESGSSSLDIGSVADIWSGAASRPGVKDAFLEKWRLTNSETYRSI